MTSKRENGAAGQTLSALAGLRGFGHRDVTQLYAREIALEESKAAF